MQVCSCYWCRYWEQLGFFTSWCGQVMHRRGRRSQQTDRVGAELSVLFGSAVRLRCAAVQTQHKLQVLVRFLLVCQRPVVCALVLWALVTPVAAFRGHFPPGRNLGISGTHEEDKTVQDQDSQEAVFGAGRTHVGYKTPGVSELHQWGYSWQPSPAQPRVWFSGSPGQWTFLIWQWT